MLRWQRYEDFARCENGDHLSCINDKLFLSISVGDEAKKAAAIPEGWTVVRSNYGYPRFILSKGDVSEEITTGLAYDFFDALLRQRGE